MCGTQTPQDLILTPPTEGACGCCSAGVATAATAGESSTAYSLQGLSCGSCVQRVESAVQAVEGVGSASIGLVPGGTSTMTVVGPAVPEDIRSAAAAAGYEVTQS